MRSAKHKTDDCLESFRKFGHNIKTSLQVGNLARVLRYDKKRHVADIQPLANFSDGTEAAQLLDVPVAENCYIIDELLERFKSDLEAVDSNSSIKEHKTTDFIKHYPKHQLMRKGVPVVYITLDRDIDNWAGGRNADTFTPNSSRTHDLNDSIIIGVLGGDAING